MSVVIGELSTNAALHGYVPGRDFRILLSVYDDVLRIEVVDTPRTRTGVRAPVLSEVDVERLAPGVAAWLERGVPTTRRACSARDQAMRSQTLSVAKSGPVTVLLPVGLMPIV
ncbi:hypothetical protein [Streptomyces anulatus]|uniref:hypothetical protein n=1 Tax=Streptomyces anulatus TaxID=1892 RepID=UPI0033266E1A